MKKKLIALFVVVALVFSAMFVLTACDNDKKITIWVSELEGVKTLTQTQIDAFIKAHPEYEGKYEIDIQGIGEGEAASQMVTDVKSGADIFCFAQDQLARVIQANAVSKLGDKYAKAVKENNDAGAVNAATSGGNLYCYPLTSDNGYFMFYDKSVIDAAHLDSMEDILADCVAAGKQFSMEVEGSAWYNAAFFFGVGCKSVWTKSDDGKKFTSLDDTYNSDDGVIAMKGLRTLTTNAAYNNSSANDVFSKGSAVLVSGTWAASDVKKALGDNYGVAKLPKFTVDGKSYQLGSFSGNKLMGVKPQTNVDRATFCNELALYLSGKDCQLERFTQFNWGPSNKEAQQNDEVKNDVALAALREQNVYATPQGQIHGGWWDVAKLLATGAKEAKDDAALKAALKTYDDNCKFLLSLTEEQMNAFTVIGAVKRVGDASKSAWDVDYEMVEDPAGTWISKDAFDLEAGDEFKVRKGLSWDTAYGTDGNNYVVETAGKYKVKLVVAGDVGTITLVPAE